ncbi:hypothetical protein M430DRAFT_193629 [Amorphotheca resinae ATCC 22711]|jgi:hypothetical protein|uniref:Uncharacterized protein n=1 Tax=Amorphotheca resinae ATCC 22711 TaxID=857342 RepID=A0A2T3AQ71_AMORE|nr:hypothetical protein M430DRAFT_193629 [Amorphotheca resinae ATCC 22711]PSS07156.1 hypothetical protein M430DRAFT_193629 [Amorphotheca resinae ATCC 22711]
MANSGYVHVYVPQKITPDEFQIGMMLPFTYTNEQIAAAVIDHVMRRGEDQTPKQKQGIKRFKDNGSWNLGAGRDNLTDLKKFFDIFNDVFFNGLLTGFCRLEFKSDYWMTRHATAGTDGFCEMIYPGYQSDRRIRNKDPVVLIALNSSIDEPRPANYMTRCLDNLAHEMLHAIFLIYARPSKSDPGHPLAWHAAAYAIKQRTKTRNVADPLLGLDLHFKRHLCMASDVQDEGANIPSASELRRVGLNIKIILAHLYNFRSWRSVETGPKKYFKRNTCIRSHWTFDS